MHSILEQIPNTPFYLYNGELLERTIDEANAHALKHNITIHYALKANTNPAILRLLAQKGIGADCVSGNEIKTALNYGFNNNLIVFAGVGKTDYEIELAIANNILCLHCESTQELFAINEIARKLNKVANVALRINPNIDARTHKYITTGTRSSKFGIPINEASKIMNNQVSFKHVNIIGLHFHIGSQITDLRVFDALAQLATKTSNELFAGKKSTYLNLGGGLGIDYSNPTTNPVANFKGYFDTIGQHTKGAPAHVELGRSLVAQCGQLITKVLFTKETGDVNFAITDAGMNALIRPALYGAKHQIINITSKSNNPRKYNIVGPICESSDFLGEDIVLPQTSRGDILSVQSCGAYAEAMSLHYNLRETPVSYLLRNGVMELCE